MYSSWACKTLLWNDLIIWSQPDFPPLRIPSTTSWKSQTCLIAFFMLSTKLSHRPCNYSNVWTELQLPGLWKLYLNLRTLLNNKSMAASIDSTWSFYDARGSHGTLFDGSRSVSVDIKRSDSPGTLVTTRPYTLCPAGQGNHGPLHIA